MDNTSKTALGVAIAMIIGGLALILTGCGSGTYAVSTTETTEPAYVAPAPTYVEPYPVYVEPSYRSYNYYNVRTYRHRHYRQHGVRVRRHFKVGGRNHHDSPVPPSKPNPAGPPIARPAPSPAA